MMTISLLSCRLSKMATLNLKPEEVILVEDQDLKIGQIFLPEELLQNSDYYVKAFDLSVHESLNNGRGNRGVFNAGQLTYSGQIPTNDLALYKFSPGRDSSWI